jgi:uncharacterized membrane protein
MDNTANFPEARANRWMLGIIGISTAIFTWLAYLQYSYFTADANDLTIVTYAFAQAAKGRFFPLYYANGSLLGNHLNIIYVLLFPIYALVQTVPFLFFLQSLFISASAWPLYLLARDKLGDNLAAVGMAVAYLIFPTVASQHLNQIHDDQFANISILFAAYFFGRENFRNMGIALVLAALTKEVVALTVAMFGVWAWLNKRTWKWIVFPLALGFGWFFVGVKLLLTLLPGAGAALYAGTPYLDLYGKSPGEVLHTMISRPGFVLQNTFGPEKRHYLLKLLGPLALILPFFSGAIVLSLPNLAINLVASNTAMIQIPWHYGVVLGATLFVAAVYSLARLTPWLSRRFGSRRYARGIAGGLIVAGLLSTGMWLDTNRFHPPPYLNTLQRAVATVPLDASVICPTPMLAHFSNRPKINTGYSLFVGSLKDPARLADYDYILLDGNWRVGEAYGQIPLYQAVKNDPAYQPVFMENNVLLLRRVK